MQYKVIHPEIKINWCSESEMWDFASYLNKAFKDRYYEAYVLIRENETAKPVTRKLSVEFQIY